MFRKILLTVSVLGFAQAVFIDTAEQIPKLLKKENPHGWQVVKMYHPPKSQAFGYKYEPYAYPKYEFEYSVSDKKTGDHKHHHEARDGDRVRGEYSLVESDGSLRKVQYHADDYNGFNAIVSKTVNKHGDHAVSVTDHTRFFYPVGHGIKINHYFPGHDYHYQDTEQLENNKDSIPVHEKKESVVEKSELPAANNEESNQPMLVIDSDKIMMVEPELIKENIPKSEAAKVEIVPIKVLPAVFPMSSEPAPIKADHFKNNEENSIAETKNTENSPFIDIAKEKEDEKKEEQNSDSEVASSYYRSIYYVGF